MFQIILKMNISCIYNKTSSVTNIAHLCDNTCINKNIRLNHMIIGTINNLMEITRVIP